MDLPSVFEIVFLWIMPIAVGVWFAGMVMYCILEFRDWRIGSRGKK